MRHNKNEDMLKIKNFHQRAPLKQQKYFNTFNMYFFYATCNNYVAYENKNGGGGYFSNQIYKCLTQNLLKNKIH